MVREGPGRVGRGITAVGVIAVVGGVRPLDRDHGENGAQDAGVDQPQRVRGPGHLLAPGPAGPHDQHGAVGLGGEHGRVGHREQRWRVDQDEVETGGQLAEQVTHPPGSEQFAGIRRQRSAGQHVQPAVDVAPGQQHVVEAGGADQHGGQAGRRLYPETVAKGRPAQVALDQRHPGAGLREGDGQAAGRRRLALVGHRAGDQDGAWRGVHVNEAQVGPQLPERLGARRVPALWHDQGGLGAGRVEGDRAQGRQPARRGDVGGRGDPGVEPVPDHRRGDAGEQAGQHAERNSPHGLRRYRPGRRLRLLPHAHPDQRRLVRGRALDLRDGLGEDLTDRVGDQLGAVGVGVGDHGTQQDGLGDGLRLDAAAQPLRALVEVQLVDDGRGDPVAGHQIGVGLDPLLGQQAALVGRRGAVGRVRRRDDHGRHSGVGRRLTPRDSRREQAAEQDADHDERPAPAQRSDVLPKFHQRTNPPPEMYSGNHINALSNQHTRCTSVQSPSVVITLWSYA